MSSASLEGQTLGKYQVLEPLGRGGMARVYRAYHPGLDRYVAIKVLRTDLVEDAEFLARFQREARAVAALRHPNIVQVYDFDTQDDLHYMVMELLEGDTLKTRLNDVRARGETLNDGEIVRIMLDVLDGLAYAHSEGMIHRDIKPANILLSKRGQAVVADFGIARIIGGTQYTAAGMVIGTLEYMAPEQGVEGRSDARSDLYSLGVVFYEMLTQRIPYEADTPVAILMKHVNDPLPLPRRAAPDGRIVVIPEPLERIVLKTLAKRPEDRYQSAAEMAQALRNAAAELHLELPERISLPLSFSTSAAPAESVAVFSGATRRVVGDSSFAEGETDITLGKRLAAAQAAAADAESAAPGKAADRRLGSKVLSALGLILMGNMAMLTLSTLTRNFVFYRLGWPTELLFVVAGLSLIMISVRTIWLLIPINILFGSAVLFLMNLLVFHGMRWGMAGIGILWIAVLTVWLTILIARRSWAASLSLGLGWLFLLASFGLCGLAWMVLLRLALFF